MSCKYFYHGVWYTQENLEKVYNKELEQKDELLDDVKTTLQSLGRRYNMNVYGFMPQQINPAELKKDIRKKGLSKVGVGISSKNQYFFQVNGKFFNPFSDKYQLTASDLPTNDRLDSTVRRFLDSIGATINAVSRLEHDAVAKVNVVNKIIEVVQGKQGLDTLTEEAVHIMVAMMRGSNEYNTMMASITNFDEYGQTKAEYGDLESYSDTDVKEEAVVKLITRLVVEQHESSEKKSLLRRWLDAIKNFFKRRMSEDSVVEFRAAAKKILNNDISRLSEVDTTLGMAEEFYQIEKNPEEVTRITDQLQQWRDLKPETKDGRYHIPSLKKNVALRVSDIVSDYAQNIYRKAEYAAKNKDIYTTKGVIIHMYNQLMIEHFKQGKVPTPGALSNQVYKTLKDHPQFENFQDKDYYTLTNKQFESLKVGLKEIYDEIMERDPDATILTEQFIYDPRNNMDDIGGTIDMMVVYSDGTIGLYDFKSMKYSWDPIQKTYLDVSDYKVKLFDLQVSRYRQILKDTLNLTDANFRETRIVPINAQYKIDKKNRSKSTFFKLEMFGPGTRKGYISQMSVAEELAIDDVNLNAFLEDLYTQRRKLREDMEKASGDKQKSLGIRITNLNKTINGLLVRGDVNAALSDIHSLIKEVERDVKNFSPSKVAIFRSTIEFYKNFNIAFKKTFDEIEDEEARKKIERVINKANGKLDLAYSMLNQRLIDLGQALHPDILEGGRALEGFGIYFQTMAEIDNNAVQTINALLGKAKTKRLAKLREFQEEIFNKTQAYEKWARANGHGRDKYGPIIKDVNGDVITRLKKEFFEDRNKYREEGRAKYYDGENYQKEARWFNKHHDFDRERWEADIETTKEIFDEIPGMSKEDKQKQLDRMKLYDPEYNDGAWFVYGNKYFKAKDITSIPEYMSPEWTMIEKPENKAAKDFVEMYYKYNDMIQAIVGYHNWKTNSVANIHADVLEKFSTLGISALFSLNTDVFRSLEVREYDMSFGTHVDGKPVRRVPVYHLDHLRGEVKERERLEIRNEVAKEYPRGTVEHEKESEKRITKLEYERGVQDKSRDLGKSLILMLQSAFDYKYKSEVEDSILVVREIVRLKQFYKETPSDHAMKPLVDYLSGKVLKRSGGSSTTQSIIDGFVDMDLYGQMVQNKDVQWESGNRTVSTTKIVQQAHKFLSLSYIAMNPVLGIASNINAQLNRVLLGKKNQYYTNQGFKDALRDFGSADIKAIGALYYFEPSSRGKIGDKAHKLSSAKLRRFFSARNAYLPHRGFMNKKGTKQTMKELGVHDIDNPYWGDENVDNTILLAVLRSWVLDSDGKIKSPTDPFHKIKDKNAKTLYELFEFSKEKMGIKGIEEGSSEFVRLKQIVGEAQRHTKGSHNEMQNTLSDANIYLTAIKKFKNWLYPMAMTRFGSFRRDALLDTWKQGHYVVFLQEVFPANTKKMKELKLLEAEQEIVASGVGTILHNVKRKSGQVLRILGELLSMGRYKYKVDRKKAEYYRLRFLNKFEGKIDPESFTLEAFIEFRENQMRAMLTELRFWLALKLLVVGTMAALGWDDDEDNLLTYNMYRLAKRTDLEISFFLDYRSAEQFFKSPVMVMRLLSDMSQMVDNFIIESTELVGIKKKNARDRTPLGYYTLKRLPGVNQVSGILGVLEQNQTKTTAEKVLEDFNFELFSTLRR